MSVKIKHRQNLLDISIQETGSLESLFDIALSNGKSITDNISVNELITVTNEADKSEIVAFYEANKIYPATALSLADSELLDNTQLQSDLGIGTMIIEQNFKVS